MQKDTKYAIAAGVLIGLGLIYNSARDRDESVIKAFFSPSKEEVCCSIDVRDRHGINSYNIAVEGYEIISRKFSGHKIDESYVGREELDKGVVKLAQELLNEQNSSKVQGFGNLGILFGSRVELTLKVVDERGGMHVQRRSLYFPSSFEIQTLRDYDKSEEAKKRAEEIKKRLSK